MQNLHVGERENLHSGQSAKFAFWEKVNVIQDEEGSLWGTSVIIRQFSVKGLSGIGGQVSQPS